MALNRARRIRVLQSKAQALMSEEGKWLGPAIECLREALRLTEPGSDEEGEVLAAFVTAYATLGNVAACRRYRDRLADLLTHCSSPTLRRLYPQVEFWLAQAYHESERLPEAEETYRKALTACYDTGDSVARRLLPQIQEQLIDVLQELARHDEAITLLSAAALPDAEYGARVRNWRAAYALAREDLNAALLWVESGLGHPSADAHARSALLLTKARIALASGDPAAAHNYAEEALRLAALVQPNHLSDRITSFLSRV